MYFPSLSKSLFLSLLDIFPIDFKSACQNNNRVLANRQKVGGDLDQL
jgi:hypothetical protein